ncbi:MAG: nucleotidyltransferase family protein, partial [Lachnospiraceae bacterium]|nr:nucleotidyltransferase family protein [Lachnospiraceae bacterium]
MKTVGIICEYNPFHNGHARQLRLARELAGESCALVCLMSGNY